MVPSVAGDRGGHARRRERTRAALVSAALGFLVEGRTDVAVQEITEAAGVGLGSFYNHFDSKEELFDAALEATLIAYGEARDSLVEGISDPAEVFAASFRLTGRLLDKNPVLTKLLLHAGTAILVSEHGLRPRALHDLAQARALGRFAFTDLEITLMATGSVLLGMAQLLDSDPGRDVGATTDEFVAMALRMLGCDENETAELLARPLPDVPALASFVRPGRDATVH
jgi:AcrR family transcriptional regulator